MPNRRTRPGNLATSASAHRKNPGKQEAGIAGRVLIDGMLPHAGGSQDGGAGRIAASKHFLPAILFVACLVASTSATATLCPATGNDQVISSRFTVNLLKRHLPLCNQPAGRAASVLLDDREPDQKPVSYRDLFTNRPPPPTGTAELMAPSLF